MYGKSKPAASKMGQKKCAKCGKVHTGKCKK